MAQLQLRCRRRQQPVRDAVWLRWWAIARRWRAERGCRYRCAEIVERTEQLLADSMRNPELANGLLMKASPGNRPFIAPPRFGTAPRSHRPWERNIRCGPPPK